MVHAEKDSMAKNWLKIRMFLLQTNKCCKFLQDVEGRRRTFTIGEQGEPRKEIVAALEVCHGLLSVASCKETDMEYYMNCCREAERRTEGIRRTEREKEVESTS